MHVFSKGKLIYSWRGEGAPVEVYEDERRRWLRFGDQALQSAVSLECPRRPVLAHVQAMLIGLALRAPPERALMLGLGGGDLVRALSAVYVDIDLTCVENNPRVLEVAKRYFALPEAVARKTLLLDASEYLGRVARDSGQNDLLLVDMVEAAAIPEFMRRLTFYDDCRDCLSREGLAVFNFVFEEQNAFRELLAMLRTAFGQAVLCLPVLGHRNVIVFAQRTPWPDYTREVLCKRTEEISGALACDLRPQLDKLLEINMAGKNLA